MEKILIVEDDQAILRGLKDNFTHEGYEVIAVTRGEEVAGKVKEVLPHLVILDIMLPGIDGFEVCRRLRQYDSDLPIIMLTAKVEEEHKIYGLDSGADDYVTKPFSVQELISRVKAVLRRARGRAAGVESVEFDDVQIDFKAYKAKKAGKDIYLTRNEFDILRLLVSRQNEPVSRDAILEEALGYRKDVTTRTIDTHILNLRKKLEKDPANPRYILTHHRVGYMFMK